MKRLAYDEMMGFGEIITERENEILVRFDSYPWFPQWVSSDKEI